MKIIILLLWSANILAIQRCQKNIYKTKFHNQSIDASVVVLWYPVEAGFQTTIGMCSSENGLPVHRNCYFDRTSQNGKWEDFPKKHKFVNCNDIERKCKEEPFEHNYLKRNGKVEKFVNKWKTVNIMETSDLQEPCLLKTGQAVTRKCLYNSEQHKAQWEPLNDELKNISCIRDVLENIVTFQLNTLKSDILENKTEYKSNPKTVCNEVLQLLTTPETVRIPADIRLTTDIVEVLTKDKTEIQNIVPEILNITNNIMKSDSETIRTSQTANKLLKAVDCYFDCMAQKLVPTKNCQHTPDGIYYKTFQFASLFFINPSCSNISGVAIYNNVSSSLNNSYRYDSYTDTYYRFLYLNQSLVDLLSESDLRVAAYFPLTLWNNLTQTTAGVDNETVLKFVLFQNDRLFPNRTVMERQPTEKVFEITIPNYSGTLPGDLPFIFNYTVNPNNAKEKPSCGYWNYSTWIETGVNTSIISNSKNTLLLCYTTHLTHFSALMGIEFKPPLSVMDSAILNVLSDAALDIISVLGCALSLFGLICIWLTATCFKTWRSQASNKVLLNMCFVLTLIMVFFLLLNMPELRDSLVDIHDLTHCVIMGGFLQYNILVLFTWMLIIAIMQYQRYVQVIGVDRPSKFVTKYALIAWGLPLIPTCTVAYLDPNSYMPSAESIRDNSAICYPTGKSLYLGVILPMGIIIIANLSIFMYIFWSLRRSLTKFKRQSDRKNIITQIRLSVFLFFLLGISWIFGMFAHLNISPVFSYLFCLTSTLQGFVLFIYFIVIDQSTRYSWITLCCANTYNTNEDSRFTRMTSTNSDN